MKSFTRFALVAVLVLSLGFVLSACSSGGGGGGSTGPSTVVTQPTTTAQVQQVASTSTQGASSASGSASTFQNFGNVGLTSTIGAPPMKVRNAHKLDPGLAIAQKLSGKFSKSKAVAKATAALKKAKTMHAIASAMSFTGSDACLDSGTTSFTGTVDDTGASFTFDITFDHCREGGTDMNGTVSLTGQGDQATGGFNFTETIGTSANKMVILEFRDDTYTMLMARFEAAVSMGMSGSYDAVTYDATVTMTANGAMDALDYLSLSKFNMTYSNAKFAYTYTTATDADEFTINGGFSESWSFGGTSYGIAMTYVDFYVKNDWEVAGDMYETISGKFGIDFTPDNCFEAGYEFVTVTPIHYNSSYVTTAGHITVNTVAHIYFESGSTLGGTGADGTIDVTLNGTLVADDIEPYELASLCEFKTMDEDVPVSTTTTGTTSGSTMTVTSLSTDSDPAGLLDCWTDVHVNYYSTATPTAGTAGTWYIDWHVSDTSTVPAGSNFQQYRDSDGDGIADVGLDINGYDYDNAADGLEHFSAYKLPEGYYVISMNNFGCPTTVSNKVNVQIGDNVFGPVNCTYTTSDIDGTTLGAWCRVADVVVTSSGVTVNLGADINTSLEPWHDGAFGMAAPAVSKARGIK